MSKKTCQTTPHAQQSQEKVPRGVKHASTILHKEEPLEHAEDIRQFPMTCFDGAETNSKIDQGSKARKIYMYRTPIP
jgi:hypothetical protein